MSNTPSGLSGWGSKHDGSYCIITICRDPRMRLSFPDGGTTMDAANANDVLARAA